MKHELLTILIAVSIVIIMSVLANLEAIMPEQYACGKIRIPAKDISAEMYTAEEGQECCDIPVLWNGGKVTVKSDLSSVEVGDMADIITFDGGHYVLECAGIIPCIRVGRWLIGWQGMVNAQGDVLVASGNTAYRFIRL